MQIRNMSILAAGLAMALAVPPGRARADLLLDTGSATNGSSERDPDGTGFGQGVSVATTTNLTQMAMFLNTPGGGGIKYMIWDGSNTTLLLSDILTVPSSASPEWILSDPLAFTLTSGNTYYFGTIQDSKTTLFAPFFVPPTSVTQNGLTTLDTGNSNYEDFLTPVFSSLAGGGFPLRLYGTQGITNPTPEPSLVLLLAGGVFAVAWRSRRASL